jgi:tRNA(Ile)-lysidine synthase
MAALGPFEARPLVAVAVSGGADSLALTHLAASWARERGGEALAVTVDHGLRPAAAAEAARVGTWLAAAGIAHAILRWTDPKPVSDIQAAARAARYRLIADWCAERHILHVLLAHHRDDQAETFLLRLGRGSGVDGLSAMAPIRAYPGGRLLRPLLDVPRARLEATLAAAGRGWIDDPSNRDPAYARVRMRALMPVLAAEGLTAERLGATAAGMARARSALESGVSGAVLAHVRLHPAGYAMLARGALAHLPAEIGLRVMGRLLLAVGGGIHMPRRERLERLYAALKTEPGAGRTLAGCRVHSAGEDSVLICRETRAAAAPVPAPPGRVTAWDGRFRLSMAETAPEGLSVGALGADGWRIAARARPDREAAWKAEIPEAARATVPALFDTDGLCAIPHLGYSRTDMPAGLLRWIVAAPAHPATVCR